MTVIESAWPKYPGYRIDLNPCAFRTRVWSGDQLLADTRQALRVEETDHKSVLYIPLSDIDVALFTATDHRSICPFKGEAGYWSLTGADEPLENVLWTYPTPMDEVAGLVGHGAFYDDRVRVEFDDPGPAESPSPAHSAIKRFPTWGDITDLVRLLDVTPDGDATYRAPATPAFGREVVDGQQILAQAIVAAAKAEPGKRVSSAHMVFSRAASVHEGITFDLDTAHKGRTFTTFNIAARQGPRLCAPAMVLCESDATDVIRHSAPMPDVAGPDQAIPKDMGVTGRDLRVVDGAYSPDPDAVGPPEMFVWARYREVGDEHHLHQAVLAQATGHFPIATAMRPHAGFGEAQAHRTLSTGNISINLTFHDDVDATEWMLYAIHSTHAGRGMSYGTGQVFSHDGRLLASYGVQGMIRGFADPAEAERGYGTAM